MTEVVERFLNDIFSANEHARQYPNNQFYTEKFNFFLEQYRNRDNSDLIKSLRVLDSIIRENEVHQWYGILSDLRTSQNLTTFNVAYAHFEDFIVTKLDRTSNPNVKNQFENVKEIFNALSQQIRNLEQHIEGQTPVRAAAAARVNHNQPPRQQRAAQAPLTQPEQVQTGVIKNPGTPWWKPFGIGLGIGAGAGVSVFLTMGLEFLAVGGIAGFLGTFGLPIAFIATCALVIGAAFWGVNKLIENAFSSKAETYAYSTVPVGRTTRTEVEPVSPAYINVSDNEAGFTYLARGNPYADPSLGARAVTNSNQLPNEEGASPIPHPTRESAADNAASAEERVHDSNHNVPRL